MTLLSFLKKRLPYKEITGCDGYGEGLGRDSVMLTRFFLYRSERGALYLHHFGRSDHDRSMHDHPWHFVSLVLWPGYWEVTPRGAFFKTPGTFLFRRADWVHRVRLLSGECPCWTLIWVGQKVREWGFINPTHGWIHWREFFEKEGCDS